MVEGVSNSRLEMFCDGVFAIAITLLVMELRIPNASEFTSDAEVWSGLTHILPNIAAYILSFVIILITWVNHHSYMLLVQKSVPHFNYANGALLLTVAFLPFPTGLLGETITTNHSSPAVVLYNGTLALQSAAWVFMGHVALRNKLHKSERAAKQLRDNLKYAYYALVLYSLFATLAMVIPKTVAILTALTWLFWIVVGFIMKNE